VTNVLVLAFNRREQAEQLGQALSQFRDVNVFVSLDGPRPGFPADVAAVAEVSRALHRHLGRRVVEQQVSSTNLGCARAVAEGLKWFFGQVSEGIVLEDDCLPTREFVDFCRLGLDAYREDESVGAICGVNYAPPSVMNGVPWARSRFFLLWGWAAWRRSLTGFSIHQSRWLDTFRHTMEWQQMSSIERIDWIRMFSVGGRQEPHTWDYQFLLHQWANGREAVLPRIPLVENTGFTIGTHSTGAPPGFYYVSDPTDRKAVLRDIRDTPDISSRRIESLDAWISSNIFSPPMHERIRRRLGLDAKFRRERVSGDTC